MTLNEWATHPIPRSTVLRVVHEYILVPVASWTQDLFLETTHWLERPSVEPVCPPRTESVSLLFSQFSWVWEGGQRTPSPLVIVFTQG